MTEHPDKASQQDTNAGREILRLRQDYATRQREERPLSHSVAVAYRQVIADRMRIKSGPERTN